MSSSGPTVAEALRAARETKTLEIGSGVIENAPAIFKEQFGAETAVIITDTNILGAAGERVAAAFERQKHPCLAPFIFPDPDLYAEYSYVERLQKFLSENNAIPVAVGSGTINDLTKLAAHLNGRSYLCVASAASMDGYTAFGASITRDGAKQTFTCPAPQAVVADLDVISAAPPEMNASGYADLLAKITAGADWILADALGIEPIDRQAWSIVQDGLRESASDPGGIPGRDGKAISRLVQGLMLGGFAMQAARSSRAASGAEHQFSHLWDMQHNMHGRGAPSHGFKVGIGTLAVTALYEFILRQPLEHLDINGCCDAWPERETILTEVRHTFPQPELRAVAERETGAKHCSREELRVQLEGLRKLWPELKGKLQRQLMPFEQVHGHLKAAGAPHEPEQIGIPRSELRQSYRRAFFLRRRFTILDVAVRCGLLEPALEEIFGAHGRWPAKTGDAPQPAHTS
ncbi:MAG TPA: sn-glycerol-1-phosphate dehydrogenase [Verrucomicrobiae bacterium]|nr:sn-glycerol-1-phosphate dehydrogenase [Verrucomicrobiae bacterium]